MFWGGLYFQLSLSRSFAPWGKGPGTHWTGGCVEKSLRPQSGIDRKTGAGIANRWDEEVPNARGKYAEAHGI
jgi:hypothetical protein